MSSQNVNLALDDIIKQRKSKSKLRVVKNSGDRNNYRRNNSNFNSGGYNVNRQPNRRFNDRGSGRGRNNDFSFADRRRGGRGGRLGRGGRGGFRDRKFSMDRDDRVDNRGDRGGDRRGSRGGRFGNRMENNLKVRWLLSIIFIFITFTTFYNKNNTQTYLLNKKNDALSFLYNRISIKAFYWRLKFFKTKAEAKTVKLIISIKVMLSSPKRTLIV